ncbi:MAG: hybrid sensor histidine kinase/response regulator [Myxococcales bacterium]
MTGATASIENPALQDRVLILAPAGRDSQLAASVLKRAAIDCTVCFDVEAFCSEFTRGAAAGVLTGEALAPATRGRLVEAFAGQPLWADFPLVVLAGRPITREDSRRLVQALDELGNVTLLDRPLHVETMVSTVRAALRARKRQYQARELLSRLQEGVRERDHFLATLSHELRNPLGAIRHATQVLKSSAVPQAERPLAIVDRQVTHLARLIDDLLDVSRVTTGKVILQRHIVDLSSVVEQTVQQMESTFAEQNLRVTRNSGDLPLWVYADAVRLEQIFTNLLTNAVKYTPAGGRIEITAGIDPSVGPGSPASANGAVWVKIGDTGIGLSSEQLGGIFDMFAQVDQSLARSQGGMGIGLTLVRSLLALHDGTVTAHSSGLGKGSDFTVRLPACQAARVMASPALAPSRKASSGSTSQRRVLLVEDNADNRELLQELLELEGYEVAVAVDGGEGVSRALETSPDIAIVDIGLPVMDGYEVARRVRAALGDQVTLVALTGYGRPEDRRRAAEAGFDTQLTKPVDLGDLRNVLALPKKRRTLRLDARAPSAQTSS